MSNLDSMTLSEARTNGYNIDEIITSPSHSAKTISNFLTAGFTQDEILGSNISDEDIQNHFADETLIDDKLYFNNVFTTGGSRSITSFSINRNNDTMICGIPFWFYANSEQKGQVEIFKLINGNWIKKSTIAFTHNTKHHPGYCTSINDEGTLCSFSDIGSIVSSVSVSGNTKGTIFTYQLDWDPQTETLNATKVRNEIDGSPQDKYRGRILKLSGDGTRLIASSKKAIYIYWQDPTNDTWIQKQKIALGQNNTGYSVTMSRHGDYIAYGDPNLNKGNGKALVFKYSQLEDQYKQLGTTMKDNKISQYGGSIQMSDDGSTVMIGTADDNSNDKGVNIYRLNDEGTNYNRIFRYNNSNNNNGTIIGLSNDGTYASYIDVNTWQDNINSHNNLRILKYDPISNYYENITTLSGVAKINYRNGTRNVKFSQDNNFLYLNTGNNGSRNLKSYKIRKKNISSQISNIETLNPSHTITIKDLKNFSYSLSDIKNTGRFNNSKISDYFTAGFLIDDLKNSNSINVIKEIDSTTNENIMSNCFLRDIDNIPKLKNFISNSLDIDELSISTPTNIANYKTSIDPAIEFVLKITAKKNGANVDFLNKPESDGILVEFQDPNLDTSQSYFFLKLIDQEYQTANGGTLGNWIQPQPQGYPALITYNSSSGSWISTLTSLSTVGVSSSSAPCFFKDVNIQCYDICENKEFYKKIQDIKKDEDYIKTFGTEKEYSKVIYLEKKKLNNNSNINPKKRLYRHKVYKDIILTGIHSMLYNKNTINDNLYIKMKEHTKWSEDFMKVGDKLKVLTFMDPNFEIYNGVEECYIYMIGIESNNNDISYGLYLENGCYAETTSIKAINKELNRFPRVL